MRTGRCFSFSSQHASEERKKLVSKIGRELPKLPTKTGPRNSDAFQKKRRKEEAEHERFIFSGTTYYRIERNTRSSVGVSLIPIAKMVNQRLWIRSNHKDSISESMDEWREARFASKERLVQETKQISSYIEKEQIKFETGTYLLDILFKLLERKL